MRTKTVISRRWRAATRLAACAALLTATALTSAHAGDSPIVTTDKGRVSGLYSGGLAEFFGIPYAAPPMGKLRWTPPQAHDSWSHTLQTKQFGPDCAQITTLGVFAGPANTNEDCLYLNVYTPSLDNGSKLPVFVWIHGGGNVDGEADDYDGSKLAAQGKAVIITFNYRLGILGWFADPALDAEGHPFANYGLLDQQQVLQWVQKNAASFGGDPTNVTLGGQSAGSEDTAANVASPLAAGLFERGIFESIVQDSAPLSAGEALGDAFSKAAGCGTGGSPKVAACLRKLTVTQILALQGTASASGPYVQNLTSDGTVIPTQGVFAAFKNGQFNHMPIMSGVVHDEYNFLLAISEYFSHPRTPPTEAQYAAWATGSFGKKNGHKVLAEFPASGYPSVQIAWDTAGTGFIVCPQHDINRILSHQVPVYAYEFNDQSPPSYFPKMPGYDPLAYHTGDIQYLFPLYHGGPKGIPHKLNGTEETLSNELVAAWTNFAWTGNPNGTGNTPWPRYVVSKGAPGYYLSEVTPNLSIMTDKDFSDEHKCGFWSKLPQF